MVAVHLNVVERIINDFLCIDMLLMRAALYYLIVSFAAVCVLAVTDEHIVHDSE